MNFAQAVEQAAEANFTLLNAMVSRRFTFDDFSALYEYFLQLTNEQHRFLALSLLNSKLKGATAREFAATVEVARLEEPMDPALLNVLGRFVYRVYKLTGQQVNVASKQLLFAFMQYEEIIPEEYINMISELNSPLEVELAEKITKQQLQCADEVPAMVAHFLGFLPRSHEILCNLASEHNASLDILAKLFLELKDERKFLYLKELFDSRFLISQPEIVFALTQKYSCELCTSISELNQENSEQFYTFFADLFLILSNYERNSVLVAQATELMRSQALFVVSPGSEQFWQAVIKYAQLDAELYFRNERELSLSSEIHYLCNTCGSGCTSEYGVEICVETMLSYLQGKIPLSSAMCACCLMSQMDIMASQMVVDACCAFIAAFIDVFEVEWHLLFEQNVFEYYDFTELTPAGTTKEAISILLRAGVSYQVIYDLVTHAYALPPLSLYELLSYAAERGFIRELVLNVPADIKFLALCCVNSIEYEKECRLDCPSIEVIPELTDFEVAYLFEVLSNQYFGCNIVEQVIGFLTREMENQALSDLVLEALTEIIPSFMYNSEGEIVLANVEVIATYLARELYSEDYLRVLAELYGSIEEQPLVSSIIAPLFNNELLQYICPYFATEEVIVRLCYDMLIALTRFGIDTFEIYVAILIDCVENTLPETRRSVFEVAGILAHLENEQIVQVVQQAVIEYQGGICAEMAKMMQILVEMDSNTAYKRDILSATLPRICSILRE